MSDEPSPDDLDPLPHDAPEAGPSPLDGVEVVEIAVVAPAAAYESIDTAEAFPGPLAPTEVDLPGEVSSPGGPEADPRREVLDALGRLGEDLGGRLDRLQAQLDRELRAESSREKVVDRLHAELQEYKNDLLLKVTRPIFIDLIQLHDDMGKMAESLGDDRAAGPLRDFQQGIEDVLYRQGVERFAVEGDGFDPRRQRAVTTVATDDSQRNKTIASRLRPGFASGEKVIRPELVSVFALRRAPTGGPDPDPAGA